MKAQLTLFLALLAVVTAGLVCIVAAGLLHR
jgi:hypothetical protein